MALQNYVDQVGPAVSAAVLNELDQIRNVVTVPVSLATFTCSAAATFSSTLTVTGAGTFSSTLSVAGVTSLTSAGNGGLTASLELSSTRPQLNFTETDAAANSGRWALDAQGGVLTLAALNDAGAASNILQFARSGGTATTLTLPVVALVLNKTGGGLAASLQFNGAGANGMSWFETDGAASNKLWDFIVSGEQLLLRGLADDGTGAVNFVVVDRTGTTMDSATFTARVISNQSGGGLAAGLSTRAGTPGVALQQTGASANNGIWDFVVSSEQLLFRILSDDGATATNYFTVDRTTTTVDGVSFPAAGTTASAANAFLDNAASPANRLLRSTSSIRYKTDVRDVDSADVAKLFDLRPISYKSLCEGDDKELRWYGLIAEEVADVLPRMVHYGAINRVYEEVEYEADAPDGTKVKNKKQVLKSQDIVPDGVQYDRLVVLLLAKLKEQQEEINDVRAELAELKKVAKI